MKFLNEILICLLGAVLAPGFAYGISPFNPCAMMLGAVENDEDARFPWNIRFRQFVKKQKGKVSDSDFEFRSDQWGTGDLTLGWNRNGSFKMYYGKQEAVLVQAPGGRSYQIMSMDHPMDLQEHDVFITYRNLPRQIRIRIQSLFSGESTQETPESFYNCVDAACKIIEFGDKSQFDARVFQPEEFFLFLLEQSQNPNYQVQVYVSKQVGTPVNFYRMLLENKTTDEWTAYDNLQDSAQFVGSLATLVLSPVLILVLVLGFL